MEKENQKWPKNAEYDYSGQFPIHYCLIRITRDAF